MKSAKNILGKKAIYGLVGNKMDLEEKIKKEEGEKYAKDINAFFLQCSAKNDKGNFEEFVLILVNEFLNRNNLKGWEIYAKEESSFTLDSSIATNRQKKKCCWMMKYKIYFYLKNLCLKIIFKKGNKNKYY